MVLHDCKVLQTSVSFLTAAAAAAADDDEDHDDDDGYITIGPTTT